jgi:hypothetical protein
MQIKVDIGTAGDKSWVRVVDQHTGISQERECSHKNAKEVVRELKRLVELDVTKKTWKNDIRQCYREAIGTGDLYAEQEAIIEVVEALIKETEQRVCNDILSLQFELPYVNWIDAPVVTAKDIIKLREKYKGAS